MEERRGDDVSVALVQPEVIPEDLVSAERGTVPQQDPFRRPGCPRGEDDVADVVRRPRRDRSLGQLEAHRMTPGEERVPVRAR